MTNVISFAKPASGLRGPRLTGSARFGALTTCFATQRRVSEDVFWLKENAELLNIFQATSAHCGENPPDVMSADALAPYEAFYHSALERIAFFPQYYRFLLGIVLDLEDLGMPGDVGQQLCAHVERQQLAEADLSDLQRGEAMRLLARRGCSVSGSDDLNSRLHRFIAHTANFTVPNRKAAYELTHIIFYLTDYGHRKIAFDKAVYRSLIYTGILALLEDNHDLLAEVCISLRYAGFDVPTDWDDAINRASRAFRIRPDLDGHGDDYHCYLMLNWSRKTAGLDAFEGPYHGTGMAFFSGTDPQGALRSLSYVLYTHSEYRVQEWDRMKARVFPQLSGPVADHIEYVRQTTPEFDSFFAQFARSAPVAPIKAPKPPLENHARKSHAGAAIVESFL